jgi:hypothetical protein
MLSSRKELMARDDLSNKLIHFTKGTDQEASNVFLTIIRESRLLGGNSFIKGGYNCVCFTESPIGKLAHILANRKLYNFDYAPFGVMVDKLWLWNQGGRPVIYQSESEYAYLHEAQRYRHKRYEPDKGIDFTWEREWRIQTQELRLEPSATSIIVPNRTWADWLLEMHINDMRQTVSIMGEDGCFYVDKYPWHFIALSDLGVSI